MKRSHVLAAAVVGLSALLPATMRVDARPAVEPAVIDGLLGAKQSTGPVTDRLVVWLEAGAVDGAALDLPSLPADLPEAADPSAPDEGGDDETVETTAPDAGAEAPRYAQPVRQMADGAWIYELPEVRDGEDINELAAWWTERDDVARVLPNWIQTADAVPDDPAYPDQWDMQALTSTNYSANLPGAWNVTTGSPGVTVAVLDTGSRPHAELVDHLLPGYDFVDVTRSNDGDGRDADASDPGDWCGAGHSSWHGTHVAGTIGATGDNASGIAGTNWNVTILPVRVLGTCNGYVYDIADAIEWAAGVDVPGVPTNPNPARIINLSLGSSGFGCHPRYAEAVGNARARGALVVAAAGNDSTDAGLGSLSSCDGVLTVANTTQSGDLETQSNFGSVVEIAAPGTSILSTVDIGATTPAGDGYGLKSGTSMAAPHVAGIAALALAVDPSLSPDQLTSLLMRTATPFPSGSRCISLECGSGIVNAAAALRSLVTPAGPPPEPLEVEVTAADGDSATVSWTTRNIFADSAFFRIDAVRPDGTIAGSALVDGAAWTGEVPGLVAGEVYRFVVIGMNSVGATAASQPSAPALPPFVDVPSFVARQFDDFAGRAATEGEVTDWTSRLTAGDASGNDLVATASGFSYWGPVVDPVTRLYLSYFKRIPEKGGLDYWAATRRAGRGVDSVSTAFAASPEFAHTYGSLSDAAFVDLVYRNVLGRHGEARGEAYWLGQLTSHTRSRGEVMAGFSESSEHQRVEVGPVRMVNLARAMVDRVPTTAEIAEYGGDAKVASQRESRRILALEEYSPTA